MAPTDRKHATIRSRADSDLPEAAAALVGVHRGDGYPVEGVDDPRRWLVKPTSSPPGSPNSTAASSDGAGRDRTLRGLLEGW
jgi:hypothetical protein